MPVDPEAAIEITAYDSQTAENGGIADIPSGLD